MDQFVLPQNQALDFRNVPVGRLNESFLNHETTATLRVNCALGRQRGGGRMERWTLSAIAGRCVSSRFGNVLESDAESAHAFVLEHLSGLRFHSRMTLEEIEAEIDRLEPIIAATRDALAKAQGVQTEIERMNLLHYEDALTFASKTPRVFVGKGTASDVIGRRFGFEKCNITPRNPRVGLAHPF
jgi:hypothetical protein